jgi:hypothetical protein
VTAPAGGDVAYFFEPHGITFARPVTVQQHLHALAGGKAPSDGTLFGAYVPDPADLLGEGEALAAETYPISFDVTKSSASFTITHFSGYILASGLTDTTTAKRK